MINKYNWSVAKTIIQQPEVKERVEQLSTIIFIPQNLNKSVYTCARLTIGRKYFIVKTKTLYWLELHLNDILKAYTISDKKADMYFPIVKHIYEKGHYEIKVDIICQDENPYKVIKAEFLALKEEVGKPLCLNKISEPYTPKYNSKTGMFGWLTKNQFLNFKKLVKANS